MRIAGNVSRCSDRFWHQAELAKQGVFPMAIRQQQIDRALSLAKEYGATRLILFGSAAEDLEAARDLYLACDGVSGWRLYELGGLPGREVSCFVNATVLYIQYD